MAELRELMRENRAILTKIDTAQGMCDDLKGTHKKISNKLDKVKPLFGRRCCQGRRKPRHGAVLQDIRNVKSKVGNGMKRGG